MGTCPTCHYTPEESQADFEIAQLMASEFCIDYEEDHTRKPIWIDKEGKEYWRWKDISDSHLINIIKMLRKKNVPVLNTFKRQLHKRKIVIGE